MTTSHQLETLSQPQKPHEPYVAALSQIWQEPMQVRLDHEGRPDPKQTADGSNVPDIGTAPDQISSILKAFLSAKEAECFTSKEEQAEAKNKGTYNYKATNPAPALPINNNAASKKDETGPNPRLVEARKLVDKMRKKADSYSFRLFSPQKAKIIREFAEQAARDLRTCTPSEETTKVLIENQPQTQINEYRKHPLTTKIELTEAEEKSLSEHRPFKYALHTGLVSGAISSSPFWLRKLTPLTETDLAWGMMVGTLAVMLIILTYHKAIQAAILPEKTDSMRTIEDYNNLVVHEIAAVKG